jgi:acetyltransferase-like isoleucine patch superfamily enzyme
MTSSTYYAKRTLEFRFARLVSEARRLIVTRRGRVEVCRHGLLIGRGCSIRAIWPGRIRIGVAVHLENRVLLHAEGSIEIGSWVFVNRDVMIVALKEITIGEGTRIAERVSIRDHDHLFEDGNRPIRDQGYVTAPIRIGRECWIGCNAVILKGVTVGDRAVVGAGAVVTRDIPSCCVAVGVPARVVRLKEWVGGAEAGNVQQGVSRRGNEGS